MFLKTNDFFVYQVNNSLFFIFFEFRALFASIHKVALNVMCNIMHYFGKVIVM